MQILKNLFQVGGSLNGITTVTDDADYSDCNTYILNTCDGLIMFDCGCGDTFSQIYKNIKYWGLDPNDIKACFITHPHLDHSGAASHMAKQGVKLYAHHETADAIQTGDERCCGYLYHKKIITCKIDVSLNDNEVIDMSGVKINAMHLPGHTMGCTAYTFVYEGKMIVISGDIIGTLLDGFFGWNGSIDFDKKIYLQSLKKFAKFDSDMMLPGHGMIYHNKPRRRVEDALNQALIQWR